MPAPKSDYELAIWRRAHGEPDLPLPPKPRKSRRNEESRHQKALIRWWHLKHAEFGLPEFALFSVPNGGWRDPIGASILKDEGQRNGVSDLFLMTARGTWHGLFIEMKAVGGYPSDDQNNFLNVALNQHYMTAICCTWEYAAEQIERYLKL